MLYREIIDVCSQIHTKHINTLCGQNVELLNVKLAAHKASSHLIYESFVCYILRHTSSHNITITVISVITKSIFKINSQ